MIFKFLFLFLGLQFWVLALAPKALALQITEVMYNPEGRDQGREWVEVYNDESRTVDPAALRFFDGRRHRVSGEALPAGEYAVLVPQPEQFRADHPEESVRLWDTVMSIRNQGELIRVINSEEREAASLSVSSLLGGDGNGLSLELRDGRWQESAVSGGTPGQPPAGLEPTSVVLHEVVASPAEGEEEAVELEGSGKSDVVLIDGRGNRRRQPLSGRARLRQSRLGFALNNEAEMIRVIDHRSRELAATPIFVSRQRGERLRFEDGRFKVVPP